ncbi:hypothetical protein CBR_g75598 [Chara braunii]|uniref:Myb/SANT-like DNA-binding domain-containing protein n=1 Tax=Chara braunii TaxID=69332 RepID=A0A388JJU9_CHABU|nr:hypothetical protein CBR_g75598 [Chara braunii]|eukprot:GBG42186.1 hypothetical protein CBR_g75598 [Chara braunii]
MAGEAAFYDQRNDCRGYGMAGHFERPRFDNRGRPPLNAAPYVPPDTPPSNSFQPPAEGYPFPTMSEHPVSMSCDASDNEPVSTPQCGQGTQQPIDAQPPATSAPSSTGGRASGRKPRQGRQAAPRSPGADGDTEDDGEGGKQKKKSWSLEERLALAKYMQEDDAMMAAVQPRQKHQRRSVRNDWMARRMKEDGYHRSAEDVRKKWADLQNKYGEIHDKCRGSGKPSFWDMPAEDKKREGLTFLLEEEL